GHPPVPAYDVPDFEAMLERERVDTVIVTSIDATHDRYIVTALERGRGVITEKPMTTDADRCRRILSADAAARERGQAGTAVAFNYRYNPLHERVRELLAGGIVGPIGSVHFEWLLDVRHGADYFRRWHRDKANSGGLLVHKSGHHFDLVNWWLADGYHRDQDVFAPGVTIEDDLAVLVRYARGATMTYHLTAYAPWEGYRVMFNGSKGRLELEVVETDHVAPGATGLIKGDEPGRATLRVHPHWSEPR